MSLDANVASEIMENLIIKSKEWACLNENEKKDILQDISLRIGDYGISYDLSVAHMSSRKIDPSSEDGEPIVGGYSVLLGILVSTYCDALRDGLSEKHLNEVNFKDEFKVDTNVKGYDVGTDGQTNVRTILFIQGDTLSRKSFYKGKPHEGEVAVVLGAGNHPFLAITDLLYHVFVEGRVAILKHHPLQITGNLAVEHVLEPLIRRGYVVSLPDIDIASTKSFVYSPHVNVVHLTGGVNSHDAIVWGNGQEAITRKEANNPLLKCDMLSELGAVTPYIVVPSLDASSQSEWLSERVQLYAHYAVAGLADNCSCNCLALKVLVLPEGQLGDAFEEAFKQVLSATKLEPAWYPGIQDRYNNWISSIEANEVTVEYLSGGNKVVNTDPACLRLPFAVANMGLIRAHDIDDISQRYKDIRWMKEEAFAPVVCIVRIENNSTEKYCELAFKFANNCLWGNLSCSVFAPPSSSHITVDATCNGHLVYGTVALNIPTPLGYQLKGYWGGPAHAGNTLLDVQSGRGTVCNSYMVDNPRNQLCIRDFNDKPIPPLPQTGPIASKVLTRFLVKGWRALTPF